MKQELRKTYARYVSLSVFGMIGLSCYILADTFFVAQGVGAEGLTALNLAIPIYSFVHGTGLMIGMGGATRFTLTKSKTIFTQSLYFVILASLLFVCIGLCFSKSLSSILGANGTTLANTDVYLKTILCFSPMFLMNNVMLCFVRNDHNPRLSMIAMLVGSLSNIMLDYVFVFPLHMGMFGAAFATGIAPMVSLFILSWHVVKKHHTFHIQKIKPQITSFLTISTIGISSFITELSSGIVIIIFNMLILHLVGNIGVAAYGILANIALVIIAIFTGIAQGIQPILSTSYCTHKYADIRRIMKYAFVSSVIVSFLVYTLSLLWSDVIISIFNKDANLQLTQIAIEGMRYYFIAFFFAGINILCAAYFSAINQTRNAFIISFSRGFLFIIPIAFLMAFLCGLKGVWMALPCTEILVLMLSLYNMKKRQLQIA